MSNLSIAGLSKVKSAKEQSDESFISVVTTKISARYSQLKI